MEEEEAEQNQGFNRDGRQRTPDGRDSTWKGSEVGTCAAGLGSTKGAVCSVCGAQDNGKTLQKQVRVRLWLQDEATGEAVATSGSDWEVESWVCH